MLETLPAGTRLADPFPTMVLLKVVCQITEFRHEHVVDLMSGKTKTPTGSPEPFRENGGKSADLKGLRSIWKNPSASFESRVRSCDSHRCGDVLFHSREVGL